MPKIAFYSFLQKKGEKRIEPEEEALKLSFHVISSTRTMKDN